MLLRSQLLPLAAVAVVASFAALVAVSCGGGGGSPAGSSPTPAPTALVPSDGPASQTCRIGVGSANASCAKQGARLTDQVMAAMELLLQQKPQLFDRSDSNPPGSDSYRVLDKNAYLEGLIANLRAAGLCAQRDPDDYNLEQIQVKSENGFSENFDVLLGVGYMWHNGASYRATCVPSSFPVERSADLPAIGSGCGRPYPPPLHHIVVGVHLARGAFDVLDSTPIVGPDADYCAAVGFTDGRWLCPVRTEGSPERAACEAWRVGKAEDTQRPGPTWRRDGHLCAQGGCENEDTNQYLLIAIDGGLYTACAENGICGQLRVRR
jgi:hypothetical protein